MRNNNVLGVIFSASSDKLMPELTQHRTTASVPIGGKYRMIDFTLSSMANSNINNVGIIAKSGYMYRKVNQSKAHRLSRPGFLYGCFFRQALLLFDSAHSYKILQGIPLPPLFQGRLVS